MTHLNGKEKAEHERIDKGEPDCRTRDLAARLYTAFFGCSDKANAKENCDQEFQDGYTAGSGSKEDELEAISQEWQRRQNGQFSQERFRRWKVGFWAAQTHRALNTLAAIR